MSSKCSKIILKVFKSNELIIYVYHMVCKVKVDAGTVGKNLLPKGMPTSSCGLLIILYLKIWKSFKVPIFHMCNTMSYILLIYTNK